MKKSRVVPGTTMANGGFATREILNLSSAIIATIMLLLAASSGSSSLNAGPCIVGARADGPPDPETDPFVLGQMVDPSIRVGGPWADYITGARDYLTKNYYFGKGGVDLLDTQRGNDIIFGGEGDDGLYGEDGNDTMMGGVGNDLLVGGPGRDIMFGGVGDDTLLADPCGIGNICEGPLVVYNDWCHGGPGNDLVFGKQGNDELYGGQGNDKVNGGDDDDYCDGGEGDDTVVGEAGDDYLVGGPGNDALFAGVGTDTLYGGPGNNILHGGTAVGKNIFVIDAQPCGRWDDVRWFSPSSGDKIVVVAGGGSIGNYLMANGVKSLTVKTVKHRTGIYVPGCASPVAVFFGVDAPVAPILAALSLQKNPPPPPSWVVGQISEPVPGVNGVPPVPPDGLLQGSPFGDKLYGFNHSSTFSNFIFGFALDDLLHGGPGPDYIVGGTHDDTIYGFAGDDRLSGGQGYDAIFGGAGRDALFGGRNIDILYAEGRGNWITGGEHSDLIFIDVPASCAATGAAPDIINDYDTDIIHFVGALTSLSQLDITTTALPPTTKIALKGCSTPFLLVKPTATVPSQNFRFVKASDIPRKPVQH